MRRFALALLITASAGCGRSGAPSGVGLDDRFPHPRESAFGDPAEMNVWHSWDVEIAEDGVATVVDTNAGLVTSVTFYISGADASVQPGTKLDEWVSEHQNTPQDVGPLLTVDGGASSFPYAGKNLTARTAPFDPEPYDVFDLQLHSVDDERYVVAAFKAPLPGHYVVTGFAAHRVLGGGENSVARILLGSAPQSPRALVIADNDMQWYSDGAGDTDLGALRAGERICFAISNGADSAVDDATEVAFTITRTPE